MPETLVRLIRNWSWPNLLRQSPGHLGQWNNIRFVIDETGPCDYAVILNQAPSQTVVTCPPEHVWLLLQEPPNEHFRTMHLGQPVFQRIYTTDETLVGPRYIHQHPALPWHVDRDFDWLKACAPPEKNRDISCVTSAKAAFLGHRKRLRFLADIRRRVEFDLFGRGFAPVADKWSALAPYRFSLVVENHQNSLYWSEKLSDCFLAWTVPIYVGCTNIRRWFPEEAVVQVDMADPHAVDKIISTVSDPKEWERRLGALEEARQRVLNQHNIFPFLANEIACAPNAHHAPREIPVS